MLGPGSRHGAALLRSTCQSQPLPHCHGHRKPTEKASSTLPGLGARDCVASVLQLVLVPF